MATLTVEEVSLSGLDPTFAAADVAGDVFENSDERVQVRFVNASGVARTITISAQRPCNHGFSHDVVLVTANGDDITVGPFDKERFNDSSSNVSITYDDNTGVTVAAMRLPKAP